MLNCPHPCLLVLPESGGSVGNKKGQPLGQVRVHSREEAADILAVKVTLRPGGGMDEKVQEVEEDED